jgi:hypothetical protein
LGKCCKRNEFNWAGSYIGVLDNYTWLIFFSKKHEGLLL